MIERESERQRKTEKERDDPVINMQCVKFFLPAKVVTRKKGGIATAREPQPPQPQPKPHGNRIHNHTTTTTRPKAPNSNEDGDDDKNDAQDGDTSANIDCVGWLALASRCQATWLPRWPQRWVARSERSKAGIPYKLAGVKAAGKQMPPNSR